MPKATQNRKQRRTAKYVKPQVAIPDDYIPIGRAPNWEVEKYPVIKGARGETHMVTVGKGTKAERDVRTFILIDEQLGPITVWESSMLKDTFDQTDDGDELIIQYDGLGKAKNGQQPPKMFTVSKKTRR